MNRFALWKEEINQHKISIILSILLIIFANFLYFVAGRYAEKETSNSVSDIILNNLPALDLSFLFVYGIAIIVIVFLIYPLIIKPRLFHVTLNQLSLLILIRSFFVSLTHLKIPVDAILPHVRIYDFVSFNNDLFFSGHVAVAFLGFLLFRKENNFLKYFFIFATVLMVLTVLFMHVHYSIDVFAAFFITYGSYRIGERLFKNFSQNYF